MKKFLLFNFLFLFFGTAVAIAQVDFTADKYSGCAPLTVTFTNQSSLGGALSWNFGNGQTAGNLSPVTTQFLNPGTYTVTLTINGQTASKTITVFSNPTASFSTSADTVCECAPVNLYSTSKKGSGGLKTFRWSFGDGTIDNVSGDTASHPYCNLPRPLPKTFTVNLVVIDSNNCQAQSVNHNVTVVEGSIANFSLTPVSSCTLPQTVSFTNLSAPAAGTYTWDFGDGSPLVTGPGNKTHTYNSAGTFTIKLTAKTGSCTTTKTATFTVRPMTAGFTQSADTVCLWSSVKFTNTSSPTPTSVLWDFGDPASGALNTSNRLDTISHVFASSGLHTVRITSSAFGCTGTITKNVYVRPRQQGAATASEVNFCKPPATVTFGINTTPAYTSVVWNFGDPGSGGSNTSTSFTPSHTFNSFGTFPVWAIVTDTKGCVDTLKNISIRIQSPTVSIILPVTQDSGCARTVNFNSFVGLLPGDATSSYTWTFGDGGTGNTGPGITHSYTTCGIFDVSLTIQTAKGCTATTTRPQLIKVGIAPTVDFTPPYDTICYRGSVNFLDASTPNGCPITRYDWSFAPFQKDATFTPPDTGKFTIIHYAYSNGCMGQLQRDTIITVLGPKALFIDSVPYPDCSKPFQIKFTDISHTIPASTKIIWDFGDATPRVPMMAHTDILHTYPGRGTYTVKLIAQDTLNGCSDSITASVRITSPKANIAPPIDSCRGIMIGLSGAPSIDAAYYSWNFGDPTSPYNDSISTQPVAHYYKTPGNYTVKLLVKDIYGCADSTTYLLHVVGPIASFYTPDSVGCRPFNDTLISTTTFTGTTAVSYNWNFDLPFGSTQTTTVGGAGHLYTVNGVYDTRLIAFDDHNCKDTLVRNDYITVTRPDLVFQPDTFVCSSDTNTFSVNLGTGPGNNAVPYTYVWNWNDGTKKDTTTTPTNFIKHAYANDSTFNLLTVSVIDSNGCRTDTSRLITVLNPIPDYTVTTADSCGYTLAQFFPDSSNIGRHITQWTWIPHGPFNYTGFSGDSTPTFQFNIPGWYGASLTLKNDGCSRSINKDSVLLVLGPQAYFDYTPHTHCPPDTVTFTSHLLSGSYNYVQWAFGDGTVGRVNAPDSVITHVYYNDGIYNPTAVIGFDNGARICEFNDTNMAGGFIIIQSPFTAAIQPFGQLVTSNAADTVLTSVVIPSALNLKYTWKVISDAGITTLIPYPSGDSVKYTAKTGDRKVVLIVTDNAGCQDYDTLDIFVQPCDSNFLMFNVFSPNGDKVGDSLFIGLKCHNYAVSPNNCSHLYELDPFVQANICPAEDFRIIIFNRWGNVVYESTNFAFVWDGKDSNGKDCSDGTYYYVLELRQKSYHGYVHLIH